MTSQPTGIDEKTMRIPPWIPAVVIPLVGLAAAGAVGYVQTTSALNQAWMLSILLVLGASSGLLFEITRALLTSGRLALDLFAPHIAFPLTFALLYAIGSVRLAYFGNPREVLSLYPYYFLGLLAYLGGALLGLVPVPRWRALGSFQPKWIPQRVRIVALSLLVFSGLITLYIWSRTGIPLFLSETEMARTQIIGRVGGYLYYLARGMTVPVALAAVYVLSHFQRMARSRKLLWSALAGGSSLILLSSGYRNDAALVLLTALIMYGYTVRRVKVRKAALIISVLLVFIAAYGLYRLQGQVAWDETAILDRLMHEIGLPAPTFQRVLQAFPSTIGYFRGRGMLLMFLTLLPGEQPALGPLLKELLDLHYVGGGFAPSILGSFYLEAGSLGIVVGMFLSGLLLALLYRRQRKKPGEYPVLFYSFVMAYYLIGIRTGVYKDILPIWFLAVLTLSHIVCRKSPRLILSSPASGE
jgi:oligosaccharide repeat unit polymerase